jgi:hypothetical protein
MLRGTSASGDAQEAGRSDDGGALTFKATESYVVTDGMRRVLAYVVLAIAGPLLAGCGGSEPEKRTTQQGNRYTIAELDENSPAQVKRFAEWACSRLPMTSLIEDAGGRAAPVAIARAKASQFPRATRKSAYAGCLEGLRSYRGAW